MAKRGRIEQPDGPVVDVTPEEREEIKRLRKSKGLTQEQLAAKIGVSNGTISNLETGRHAQVHLSVLVEVRRYLGAKDTDELDSGDRHKKVMDGYLKLDGRGQAAVEALIDSLLSSRRDPR